MINTKRIALLTTKTLYTMNDCRKKLLSYIPSNILLLLWFNPDTNERNTIFQFLTPHVRWTHHWKKLRHTNFQNEGYYLWIVWNEENKQKEYYCLEAQHMKKCFHVNHVHEISMWHDQAIVHRLMNYVYPTYHANRKKHQWIDMKYMKQCILKRVSIIETSMYIKHNLTVNALIWLYENIIQQNNTKHSNTYIRNLHITDMEFEERHLYENDYLLR